MLDLSHSAFILEISLPLVIRFDLGPPPVMPVYIFVVLGSCSRPLI